MFWTAAALLALAAAAFAAAPLRKPRGWRRSSSRNGEDGPRDSRTAQSHDGDQECKGDAQEDGGAVQGDGKHAPAGRRQRETGRALAVRALYRQRLEELEEEARAGLLDEASRAEMERELAQGLLRDFAPDEGLRTDRPSRLWVPVALAVPLAALALYLHLGEPQAEMLRTAAAVLDMDPEQDRLQLDRWRRILSERLAIEPEDGQSRYLLGHVHLKEGSYRQAAAAFALAQGAAGGDDPSIDWHWFQALYLANEGRLDDAARRIAQRILARNPNQMAILEILILDAYRRNDYQESVSLLNRALAIPGDPHRQVALAALMKQARAMLGDLQPSIDIQLTAAQPPPAEATLFVIARPPGGGMPFAVVRRPAAPLPEAVRLDDAVSMNPAAPLSAAAEVEVIARISLTGTATPHPGDWQWRSEPLSLTAASEPVQLAAQLRPPG